MHTVYIIESSLKCFSVRYSPRYSCAKIFTNSLVFHSVDSESGEFYYFNFATGETQWEHPLDDVYRQKVR